jgi:hypothetical protein
MKRNRYFTEKAFAETDCECPPHLCTHPEGFKSYHFWLIVDRETDLALERDYDVYAEAKRECDRLNREAVTREAREARLE